MPSSFPCPHLARNRTGDSGYLMLPNGAYPRGRTRPPATRANTPVDRRSGLPQPRRKGAGPPGTGGRRW
jgi:hypothetical protein